MDSNLKSVVAGHKGAVMKLLFKFDELKSNTNTEVDEVKALDDAVTQKQKTLIDLNSRLLDQTSEEYLEQKITDSDELNANAYNTAHEVRVDMNTCTIDSMNEQYSIHSPAETEIEKFWTLESIGINTCENTDYSQTYQNTATRTESTRQSCHGNLIIKIYFQICPLLKVRQRTYSNGSYTSDRTYIHLRKSSKLATKTAWKSTPATSGVKLRSHIDTCQELVTCKEDRL
ncbi:unnamed protein product [Mytilus coruscus]|uniref:Uncharacterized protein n=1 Tax=Mytilus coruscus TaxID=42192 RepID=A0A6J8CQF6_MYTCO|nr:unnamed protein product [Mytilus coruscus]